MVKWSHNRGNSIDCEEFRGEDRRLTLIELLRFVWILRSCHGMIRHIALTLADKPKLQFSKSQ